MKNYGGIFKKIFMKKEIDRLRDKILEVFSFAEKELY